MPGLIIISIPGLSVFDTISIFSLDARPTETPFARILYAPAGISCSPETASRRSFSILSISVKMLVNASFLAESKLKAFRSVFYIPKGCRAVWAVSLRLRLLI